VANDLKLLLLDIETSPNIAHVWDIHNPTVGLNQLIESTSILCWAAKWLDDSKIMWARGTGKGVKNKKQMLTEMHDLLSEADAVVHYNGARFDMPTLNKEFVLHGMTQPQPYKQIDLLKVVKKKFRFPSNKLEYVSKALGVGAKAKNSGHETWIGCMNDDPAAWAVMEKYNKQDVVLLEKVYYKLLPWMTGVPNRSLYNTEVCPVCGEQDYQRRGYAYTLSGKFNRFQCKSCASWFRGTVNQAKGDKFVGL